MKKDVALRKGSQVQENAKFLSRLKATYSRCFCSSAELLDPKGSSVCRACNLLSVALKPEWRVIDWLDRDRKVGLPVGSGSAVGRFWRYAGFCVVFKVTRGATIV